jgi:hypothetical protein
MLNEMKAIDDIVVPCRALKVHEEANEPNYYPDSNALGEPS